MLTSTLCTLVFFARTAIASSKLPKTKVIATKDGIDYKIQMTQNDLDKVKGIPIDYYGRIDHAHCQRFEPVDIREPLVQETLQDWTALLEEKEQKGHASMRTSVADRKDIAQPSGEVEDQFEQVSVWMANVGLHGQPGLHQLFIIRAISPNVYELVLIEPTPDDIRFRSREHWHFNDEVRFVYDQIGEKRFTEISSLFAQQQIHHLEGWLVESRLGNSTPGKLKIVQKDLDMLVHQEFDRKAAIQRETQDRILREERDLRAAVSKECTRWKSEVEKMEAEKVETEKKHREEIFETMQQKVNELKREKDIFAAEKEKLNAQFEDRKKEWGEYKELMKGQLEASKSQSESLDGKKAKSEKLIETLRETKNVLEKQNGDLHTKLIKSEGNTQLLSEKLKRANDENTALVHENNELKHLKSRFDDIVAKKDEVQAHNRELQEKLAKSEEEQRKLEATNSGLLNNIVSLQNEKKEVEDRENVLEARNAETRRELDLERSLHDAHDAQLEEQQQAAVEAEQRLREKEEGIDHWIMISMFIGGGILVVIGFTIFQLARRTYNEMYDDMEYELNEQLKRVKEPHPLVPAYPSAHANRLGVHEHPAVRDVFGMKEPWDVTPGEGFHVSRITSGGDTPGTSRGEVDDETTGVPVMEGMSEGDVMEHDKEQMAESAENFDI